MLPSNTGRLASADLLKASAIIAVVFIHASLLLPFVPSTIESSVHLNPSLYTDWLKPASRFCVPVFITLWAYFAEVSLKKRGSDYRYLSIRLYKLFIPFFFWSLLYFILTVNIKTITISGLITKHWSGYGWSGQYYFIILFQLVPLFVIIRYTSQYINRYFWPFIIICILFYAFVGHYYWFSNTIVDKVNDRPFIYWLPYVLIGIIYAKRGVRNHLPISLTVLIILAVVSLIPLESVLAGRMHMSSFEMSPYMKPSVFIASLVLVYLALGKNIHYNQLPSRLATCVNILATNTLGIFCLNPLIVILISYVIKYDSLRFQFPGCVILIPLLSIILVISSCILLINVLKRLKLGVLVAN